MAIRPHLSTPGLIVPLVLAGGSGDVETARVGVYDGRGARAPMVEAGGSKPRPPKDRLLLL